MRNQEDNRRPEEIASDIERTRAQVGDTIDAIQNKLTPGQMMDQAMSYARTSLPADFGANLGNAVRDNPVPIALVGIGLAWLAMAGRGADGRARQRHRELADYDRDFDYAGTYGPEGSASDTEGGSTQEGRLRKASAKVSETGHRIKDKASELSSRISETASSITGRARERMQGSSERMGALNQRTHQRYDQARDSMRHMVDEQPLVIGALGIAIGAMLGAVLPGTRREDELMGSKRDDLLESAKQTAREQAEGAKESAQRVAQTVKQEADRAAGSMAGTQGNGQAGQPRAPVDIERGQTGAAPGSQGLH